MTKILVIAEHFDGEIISSTSKTVNCASQISESIDILVLGDDNSIALKASNIESVKNVIAISNQSFEYPVSSIMAPVVAEISKEYDCILLPSSTFGKDLAPRISAILDVNQVTDIMSVEGPRVFKRPIYAGNAIQTIKLLYQLADKLGASVGASRAAVDAGFVPNDMQVGQTGKIIAPQLYFAFGISGAIQHIAGIKDSGTIVAVNKDADAPIFEIADIGIVADLFEFIPELTSKLG